MKLQLYFAWSSFVIWRLNFVLINVPEFIGSKSWQIKICYRPAYFYAFGIFTTFFILKLHPTIWVRCFYCFRNKKKKRFLSWCRVEKTISSSCFIDIKTISSSYFIDIKTISSSYFIHIKTTMDLIHKASVI